MATKSEYYQNKIEATNQFYREVQRERKERQEIIDRRAQQQKNTRTGVLFTAQFGKILLCIMILNFIAHGFREWNPRNFTDYNTYRNYNPAVIRLEPALNTIETMNSDGINIIDELLNTSITDDWGVFNWLRDTINTVWTPIKLTATAIIGLINIIIVLFGFI